MPVGLNTLTIQGIYDTTTLRNELVPYSTVIEMKDLVRPKVSKHSGIDKQIIIEFSKKMDEITLSDPRNYLITFNGSTTFMPEDAHFSILNDGYTLMISLPNEINNKEINIGVPGNLTGLQLMRLKDLSGNYLEPDIVNLTFNYNTTGNVTVKDFYDNIPGKEGILAEPDIVKIRFSQPILSASITDFNVYGRAIYEVNADGSDIVTLKLSSNFETTVPSEFISIRPDNKIKSIIGTGVQGGSVRILDKVSPRIRDYIYYLSVQNKTIEMPFTEQLEKESENLYRRDLEVIRLSDGYILNESEYATSLKTGDNSTIVISILNPKVTSSYMVRVKGNPQYIRDKDGNAALESTYYYTDRDIIGY